MSFFADTPLRQGAPPEDVYRHFASMRIGARTVDAFGVSTNSDGLQFRYAEGARLFNFERLSPVPDPLVIAGSEPDVLALFEAGHETATCLPSRGRSEALALHADMLAGVRRITLAGASDRAGVAIREELARRLGRHRCWLVAWPDGCHDACSTLLAHGPEAVTAAIAAAEPYPIEGIQQLRPLTLLELRMRPAPALLTTGTSLDHVVKFPGEGKLVVITGIPNAGKSVFAAWVMIRLMERHDRRFFVFSPEMEPWQEYSAHCAAIRCGRPFRSSHDVEQMSDAELISATEWLLPRLTLLVADPEGDAPTIEWFLERAAASVLRNGTTDVVIDPWGDLEHPDGDIAETKYISRSLQKMRNFAKKYGSNLWIIAHPRVQRPAKLGEKIPAPGLYEISGSAAWANKADLGLTVHTPAELTEVHVCKARFRRWGRRGQRALLAFDAATGRYSEPAADVGQQPARDWSSV